MVTWGETLFLREIRIYTLSGKKMSGESNENFEGVTKFSPDEFFPRYSFTRPKLLPDFLMPDQNFSPIFLFQQKKDFYRSFPL